MPFTTERTELIKAGIRAKLDSGSANDWEKSFLENMEALFLRDGSRTRLSKAQFGKLHNILKLERPSREPKPTSRQIDSSANSNAAKPKPPSTHTSNVPRHTTKPRARPRTRIVNTPMYALRRLERKLFFPILLVVGILAFLGNAFEPSTSTGHANGAAYVVVTGSNVNQREGPSTSHHVMGQLSVGTRVRKIADQNGWSQIVSPLGTGWMSSNFLSAGRAGRTEQAQIDPNIRTVRSSEVRVIDGDTVSISGQRANVRLVGFNTPEISSPSCNAEHELGRRATARLGTLLREASSIQFRRVACACRPGTEGTRQCNYGRQCGFLLVDGTDVAKTLIREGLAVPYRCGAASCPPRPGNWCR